MSNISVAFGMDIGGTLTKLLFWEPSTFRDEAQRERVLRVRKFVMATKTYGETGQHDEAKAVELPGAKGGIIHFVKWETRKMENAVRIMKSLKLLSKTHTMICATGGGAVKFERLFKQELGLNLLKFDELETLLSGLTFFVEHVPDELYRLENFNFSAAAHATKVPLNVAHTDGLYPFLVVNIGSGVSIMRVDGPGKFKRVGGTTLGGGTFYGMCCAFAGVATFDDAMSLCRKGKHVNVDLTVGDIYGGDYKTESFTLGANVVASAFGKMTRPEYRASSRPEDVARAILTMISSNIGVIACLHAKVQSAKRIIFSGSFLNGNEIARRTLSYYVDHVTGGESHAYYLEHDGYFGAMGALNNHLLSLSNAEVFRGRASSGKGLAATLPSAAELLEPLPTSAPLPRVKETAVADTNATVGAFLNFFCGKCGRKFEASDSTCNACGLQRT